jgi:trigger factor
MQITMTEPEPWLRELEIEVEPERVRQKIAEEVDHLQRDAEIPGFRRGHAPRSLIESRFASAIEAQTAGELIREAYEAAIAEKDLRPIKPGEIGDYELTPGRNLRFKISLEVLPDFELKNYLGIPVKRREPTGFDAEFERRLNLLREKLASYTPLSRPSQAGDYLLVDYTVTGERGHDAESCPPFSDRKTNIMLLVGDRENLPALNEQLVGLQPGEEKDVVVRVPDDYEDKAFAGRTLKYHIGVRSIKEKHRPELDQEFAANLGFENLDQVREYLNTEIMSDREKAIESDELNQIYQCLLANHNVEPPPSLVEDVYQQMLLTNRITETEETKDRLRKVAQAKAKFQMIVARIAREEKIEVSDEERNKVIEDYVANTRAKHEEFEAMRRSESFRYRLLEDKVMHYLLEKAQIS